MLVQGAPHIDDAYQLDSIIVLNSHQTILYLLLVGLLVDYSDSILDLIYDL